MATKMKTTKKISPKDKDKVKTTITKAVYVNTDGKKVTSMSRSRNVSHNKKNK